VRLEGVDLSRRDLQCLLRISGVVSATGERAHAAHEVLELFRSIVPYAAASISTWNPFTDRHETLASVGYPASVQAHLDTWFVDHDEVFKLMRTVDPRPLRWRDMPFDYRRMYSAREVFMPAGFNEGVTTCLYTPDGRYTGSLHVSTDAPQHPSDAAMHALAALQGTLAGLADGLRSPGWIAASLEPMDGAALVTRAGGVVALPGRAAGTHLARDSLLVAIVVAMLREGPRVDRFLWQDDEGAWHRVRLHALEGGALVAESADVPPFELTPRELDVLTLLAQGRSNPEIARTLTIAVKTAAKHVEHVLEKLGCDTRAGAAARAVQEGLVCPRAQAPEDGAVSVWTGRTPLRSVAPRGPRDHRA
jgi:DNA-binding CsgD family transcriptional regulator